MDGSFGRSVCAAFRFGALLVLLALAPLAARAAVQRTVTQFDRAGRQVGEKQYDERNHLTRETSRRYAANGQPARDSTREYAPDGSRVDTVTTYVVKAHAGRMRATTEKSEPEIQSESEIRYDPSGRRRGGIRTDYGGGKRTRATEFECDGSGEIAAQHITLYRADGIRVREELFDTYYPGSRPLALERRVRTLQDEHQRTTLIASETYARKEGGGSTLIAGTRQILEYADATSTQPNRQSMSEYDAQRGEWRPHRRDAEAERSRPESR